MADHHAPLYSRPWDVSKRDIGDTGSPNVDKSVQWLISQGMWNQQLLKKVWQSKYIIRILKKALKIEFFKKCQ